MWGKIGWWLVELVAPPLLRKVLGGIKKTEPYLAEIYDYVRTVAQLTPTRADDELLRAADVLGVPLEIEEDRGQVLMKLVLAAVKKKWPNVPERVLRRAIELAYGGVKP